MQRLEIHEYSNDQLLPENMSCQLMTSGVFTFTLIFIKLPAYINSGFAYLRFWLNKEVHGVREGPCGQSLS